MSAPRVVGLDISLTGTGVASSRGWCDVVGMANVTTTPLVERISKVDALCAMVLRLVGTPDLAVVEVPAYQAAGGRSTLERSALWWLVVRSLIRKDVPIAQCFNNSRMRYATGKGTASKAAIVDAVARRYPAYSTAGNDNLCDAVVLCAMGADYVGFPLASVPKTHRAALEAVTWPAGLAIDTERGET